MIMFYDGFHLCRNDGKRLSLKRWLVMNVGHCVVLLSLKDLRLVTVNGEPRVLGDAWSHTFLTSSYFTSNSCLKGLLSFVYWFLEGPVASLLLDAHWFSQS